MTKALTLDLAGDNTLTISLRYDRTGRQLFEAVEYGNDDYRVVHYSGEKLLDCVDISNAIIVAEEDTIGVKHDRFELETVRDALFPDVANLTHRVKTQEAQLATLGTALCEYMAEGMIGGSTDVHRVLEKLWIADIIEPSKVTVRVQGTMTRTFTIDTEIEVMPWHAHNTEYIESHYEDEVIEATDDDYDCSTELDIDSVEPA